MTEEQKELQDAVQRFLSTLPEYQEDEETKKQNVLYEVLLGESVSSFAVKAEAQTILSALRSLTLLALIPETKELLKVILMGLLEED